MQTYCSWISKSRTKRTAFLTRSSGNFHVHRSLRTTSPLQWEHKTDACPTLHPLPNSLPVLKSLPRRLVSAAFGPHSHLIYIPVAPAQTHFLCRPCTWPTLGHSLLPAGVPGHYIHFLPPHLCTCCSLCRNCSLCLKK